MEKPNKHRNRISGMLLIMIICLQLYTLGVMALERVYALMITAYVILYHFVNSGMQLRYNRKSSIIPLVLWGFSYAFMLLLGGVEGGVKNFIYYFVIPLGMVGFGYILVDEYVDSDSSLFKAVLLMTIGFSVHACLNILQSIKNGTFRYNTERVYDIWTGDLNNRTIIGIYLLFLVCIGIPIVMYGHGVIKSIWRIIAFAGTAAAVVLSIYLGNRTLVLIAVLLIAGELVLSLLFERKSLWILIGVFLFVLILYLLYMNDVFGMRSGYIGSYFESRLQNGVLSSGRWEGYVEIFRNFWKYMGGVAFYKSAETEVGYAHNVWLDIYVRGGILPLLAMVSYALRTIASIFRLKKSRSLFAYHFAFSVIAGIMLCWAVEPALIADPYCFAACIGCMAILEKYSFKEKLEKRENYFN